MSFKGRIAAGVVVVFLAGVATGLFAGAWHARRVFINARFGHSNHHMQERLKRELNLTPEQEGKISPILTHVEDQLEAIRADTSRRVSEVMTKSHQDIAPYLTPEQQVKLDEIAQRHRRMMRAEAPPPPNP